MKKNIDCGHYVDCPLPADAIRIGQGQSVSLTLRPHNGEVLRKAYAMDKDSELRLSVVILPDCGDAQLDITIDLLGENANVKLAGVCVCRAEQKTKLSIQMNHRVRSCFSRQLFKSVVAENASTVFDGRITVAPDASKTQAFQENHNLLLSDTARAETRPQLEIYTDDVACSHGATLGRLNLEEQFYMRSRGIPEDEAKVLQMISFLAPAISLCHEDGTASAEFAEVEAAVRAL